MTGNINGTNIKEFTLRNKNGMEVSFIDYGCTITKIIVPDREGNRENVVLGYEKIDQYADNPWYLGAIIGRFAGRIGGGSFELDGKTYTLEKNDGNNHLHGGESGFDKVIWQSQCIAGGVQFTHESPDGDGGYPGNLKITVTYTLNDENEFAIQYEALSDERTLLNMTNHTYFNLSGGLKRDITDHVLQIDSDQYAELNDQLLPTGTIQSVAGTAFDFRRGQRIQAGVESADPQNKLAGEGYDHPFVLSGDRGITLSDKQSGRVLNIKTDQACVVLYSGTQIKEGVKLDGGTSQKYAGLCLETQGLPDSIHHPHFPQSTLRKDERYVSRTVYRFSTRKGE
ncbi:galactose mutarotase [Domibacillus sp. A3M-37]|uniref:aldose epimerase family protein n=1 Tax=Domibacillus sp. A3M-37 TaxID=2962037 RepID=UPI0020B7AB79|nr:aldose epimerase family protein [Domibacillus sp. A3M-37]MCP3763475.1 galactose mutarotase [Domibacillus sp. A3M-37]